MKKELTVIVTGLLLATGAMAEDSHEPVGPLAPAGFGNAQFEQATVADIEGQKLQSEFVSMRGSLTEYLGEERSTFKDEQGNTIRVKLDEEDDYSNISKDQLINILGEVRHKEHGIVINVLKAAPAQQ